MLKDEKFELIEEAKDLRNKLRQSQEMNKPTEE